MQIYILTLAECVNRYNLTVHRLMRAGLDPKTFVKRIGIHGVKEPDLLKQESDKWKCSDNLSSAQKGCSFSHFNTMEVFLETDDEYCMIVEDDLILPINFDDMLDNVTNLMKSQDFDILFVGWGATEEPYEKSLKPFISYYPMCDHCYIVSRKGARKICDAVETHGLTDVIDVWFVKNAKNLDIKSLCVSPFRFVFNIPVTSRMDRANGIAFQDNEVASIIDVDKPFATCC